MTRSVTLAELLPHVRKVMAITASVGCTYEEWSRSAEASRLRAALSAPSPQSKENQ